MMSAQENVQVAQQMFAALGQGNLMAALDTYAEDCGFPITSHPNQTGGDLIAQAASWP